MSNALFIDRSGREYCTEDILEKLKNIEANQCDALFIHSDVSFGRLAPGIKRHEYLQGITDAIQELNVPLLVPTFTYSFCNNEIYDVNKSKTSMGALNEYLRKLPDRYRTLDPLLSISVPADLKSEFEIVSDHSLGTGSGLDIVHHMENVKFLFLGARMGNCFTYLHYIEKILNVPYRYDQDFSGTIIDQNGNETYKTQYMHTACFGVKPADFYYFEDEMVAKGYLNKTVLGDSAVACIDEKDAYREIINKINKNIYYFLEQPFTEKDLVHKYTKGLDGSRITHC